MSKTKRFRVTVNGKRLLRSRYVMEQHLDRKLKTEEIVHHINEDRTDDKIENLQVMTLQEHNKIHSRGIKKSSKEGKKKYRIENREKISKQRRKHYQENKERVLKQQRGYWHKNKEWLNRKKREYYQRNKNEINRRRREARKKKKEEQEW